MTPPVLPLILGSTSPYRRELMEKLGIIFTCEKPICDEDGPKSSIHNPLQLATTLALMKAQSLARPTNCVIGGDQVIALEGEVLGKPGNFENACNQILRMQGKIHQVITAINVIYQGQPHSIVDITENEMRRLTREQVENYVRRDQPYDCAGSYKIEKSGLVLMKQVRCADFSAIQGIPLIKLTDHLESLGYQILRS